MQWALDHAELGPVLRQAAAEGWDQHRMRGAVVRTQWWRVHGLASVADQLERRARAYLLPMGEDALRTWAVKIATGEVQAVEFEQDLRRRAVKMWPSMADALERGFTTDEVLDEYRQLIARRLEIVPQAIDFMEPKWRRLVEHVDPKTGQRVALSLPDAEVAVMSDPSYGYEFTRQARGDAAQLRGELRRKFGLEA